MDIRRIDKPRSWEEMLAIVKEVANTPGICKTLVIDTADWAEQLITTYLCNKYKQNSIESFGYGKGYTYMAEEFARLFLERRGIFPESVKNTGLASLLIDRLKRRQEEGLATPKQIRCLERYGFRQVGTWSFEDANALIGILAGNGWKIPYGI